MINSNINAVPSKKITYTGSSGAITLPAGYIVWCIIPDTDTVFSASTDNSANDSTSNTNWIANVHPAGVTQYGMWSALTVTSGTGNLYLTK